MASRRLNRRDFVTLAGLIGVAAADPAGAAGTTRRAGRSAESAQQDGRIPIPDDGWRLLVDEHAPWQDDPIFLPGEFDLQSLPDNPPTGGWEALAPGQGIAVTLPATVEQHFWGKYGSRPYTLDEFTYADKDSAPKNGAWRGVSWWWREIDIPAEARGRRIILTVRGARLRAEVYLNRVLVGYSIIEELPFDCDLTGAAEPGGKNLLAIRITNPGGRYDWVDGETLDWGKARLQSSHGFGGLDRGLALSLDPMDGRIADLWVLNTPERQTVHAFVTLAGADPKGLSFAVVDAGTGRPIAALVTPAGRGPDGAHKFLIRTKRAKPWSLERPNLCRLTAAWNAPGGARSVRSTTFGLRWFAPDGLGRNAVFRLNGRRIKLTSAISWGYWGFNGLWPTPELAEKEVTQAKALGLNCLNFHRNVGKEDVLKAQDRLGLLRAMEPGGGKFAVGKLPAGTKPDANSVVMQPPQSDADRFCQRHMLAKCLGMIRAFRSHPSLILWCLQNEIGLDFSDPEAFRVLDAMRAEDPSRVILLNDGLEAPPQNAAQAWIAPYGTTVHRSDREAWGGWFDHHQGAGDQWYDAFYKGPRDFTYRQTFRTGIVEYGEMEGCAVPDNHARMAAAIAARGGASYDLDDHREILAATDAFLDRWGFRAAFPTADALFDAIGRKSYESWQQYLENARINDATDFSVISGWESTAIDNHSGLVDNLRDFRADPALIRASLLPVRPVAKQRALVVARGSRAVFDLFLLNDTGLPARGRLAFSLTNPQGRKVQLASFRAPAMHRDRFCGLIKEGFATPPLLHEGLYRFAFAFSGAPHATQYRDLWVSDVPPPVPGRTLRVAVAGVWPRTRDQLAALPGVAVEDFAAGQTCAAIVSCGLNAQSTEAQRLGGDEGITLQRAKNLPIAPGALAPEVVAAVKAGTPLLVLPQEDGLADGVAAQLAAAGALRYDGQVGRLRAPWMGNWTFVRAHPLYDGLPADQAMGVLHQARGRQANGLMVDGEGVEVCAGYGRDHDRRLGAATFTARLGAKLVFQRVPDLNGPMQLRFLSNALKWLCG